MFQPITDEQALYLLKAGNVAAWFALADNMCREERGEKKMTILYDPVYGDCAAGPERE